MYGPYIQVGKRKQQTYLHAFIDDAIRMITFSKFYFEQNFETLRISLKEAMQRRFPGNRRKTEDKAVSPLVEENEIPPRNTISFTELLQGGTENV